MEIKTSRQPERWWQAQQPDLPPDDAPLLAPYGETRPGFEVLFGPAKHFAVDDTNRYQVCLWDIWSQEDPAEQDTVLQRINTLQAALGALDDESRFIRLQIACLQRCWWEFPANVDLVLRGISSGVANLDGRVSCEPPWADLCTILRHRRHHPAGLDWRFATADTAYDPLQTRQSLSRAYMTTLTWWVFSGDPDQLVRTMPEQSTLVYKIYHWLGQPDQRKVLYVMKLWSTLGWQAFPTVTTTFDDRATTELLAGIFHQSLQEKHVDGDTSILQMIDRRDLCRHAFFRNVDHQLAAIGTGHWVDFPDHGTEKRRIQDAVTNYVHTLGSWLSHRTVSEATSSWPPAEETVRHVYAILGAETPVKRWLAASLWKHLYDNQASHGRGELDKDPERFALPEGTLE